MIQVGCTILNFALGEAPKGKTKSFCAKLCKSFKKKEVLTSNDELIKKTINPNCETKDECFAFN